MTDLGGVRLPSIVRARHGAGARSIWLRAVFLAACACLTVVVGGAVAESSPLDGLLSSEMVARGSRFLSVGDRVRLADQQPRMDYTLFANELIAYVAREIFDDESDEYRGGVTSRLLPPGPSVAKPRSRFGADCVTVLGQIGREVSPLLGPGTFTLFDGSSTLAPVYSAVAGAMLFGLREVWKPLRNETDDRAGFSLKPKLSTRKFGLALSYRW